MIIGVMFFFALSEMSSFHRNLVNSLLPNFSYGYFRCIYQRRIYLRLVAEKPSISLNADFRFVANLKIIDVIKQADSFESACGN